jgi:hypothetical protein
MLLLVTEQAIELQGNENVIVRTPAELYYIQPQGPALVIIDIKQPNSAVLEWASKRTRATLWWLVGANLLVDIPFDAIPLQHCCVHQAHIGSAEFIQLLAPYYFGRFLDDNPDFIFTIDPGGLEKQLVCFRELALIPEHSVNQTQAIWSYLYWFTGSALDMSIEEYEQHAVKLQHDLGAEQMCCQMSNLTFSSFVLLLR